MPSSALKDRADAFEIRYASSQPVIGYTLKVDSADVSSFEVEMDIRNIADTFLVAITALFSPDWHLQKSLATF